MKRSIVIGLGAIAAVVVVVIIGFSVALSPSFVSQELAAVVKARTGRTLTVGGTPQLSLWPEVAVTLNDVSLSNPPGMFEGELVRIDALRLRIGLRELLAKQLEVKEVAVLRPRLSLIVDGEGKNNWSMTAAGGAEGAGSAVEGAGLAPISIEDGDVRFLDERSASSFTATGLNFTLGLERLDGPLDAAGNLTWKGDHIRLNLYAKSPSELAGAGSPIDLTVESGRLNFSFSGLAALKRGLMLAGSIEASGESLRDLAEWAGHPIPPGKGFGSFKVAGAIDLERQKLALKKASIGLDGMNATGDLAFSFTTARPLITATIDADRIDLNSYLDLKAAASEPQEWSDAPISFQGLKAADARISMRAGNLIYGDVRTGKVAIDASFDKGILDAKLTQAELYGGTATGRIILKGDRPTPAIEGVFTADGVDAYRLFKDFADLDRLDGKANINLSVSAIGKSQREFVSTLKGAASFRLVDGGLRGISVPELLRTVSERIVSGWQEGPQQRTSFQELSASFSIGEGIAVSKDLKLTDPLLQVSGMGEADLLRRAFDWKLDPMIGGGLETDSAQPKTELGVPVIVRGPWSAPRIYPDMVGILDNPQAAYQALKKLKGDRPSPSGSGAAAVSDTQKSTTDPQPLPVPPPPSQGSQ